MIKINKDIEVNLNYLDILKLDHLITTFMKYNFFNRTDIDWIPFKEVLKNKCFDIRLTNNTAAKVYRIYFAVLELCDNLKDSVVRLEKIESF